MITRRRFLANMAAAMVAPVITPQLQPVLSPIDVSDSVVPPQQIDWSDPFTFMHVCWPDKVLYERQREIVESVRDNLQTFCPAANEMGKTHVAALLAIWFYATRSPCRVVMFSSSQDQLQQALWPEIKALIAESKVDFGWRIVEHRITKYTDNRKIEVKQKDLLVAHVTTEVERFHGVHLPEDRPRILVIFDEASAVRDEFLEAAESFAHKILVIGNPLNNVNFFYRGSKGGEIKDPVSDALMRKVIAIDGDDSPNVQAGKMAVANGLPIPEPLINGIMSYQYMVRNEVVWDEETKARRLHGVFYEGAESMLIPFEWLDHSMDAKRWAALRTTERNAIAMGVDVAQGGNDQNCWTVIDSRGIMKQIVSREGDAVKTAQKTLALMMEHNLAPSQIAMDMGGGGKEVADILRHGLTEPASGEFLSAPVKVVAFGERPGADDSGRGKARKKRVAWSDVDPQKAYFNRRAEMYGNLRVLMNPGQPEGGEPFMIGPDAWELRKELQPVPLLYDEEGKMKMLSKDEKGTKKDEVSLKKLIGHSPDRSDSLVLAIHAMKYGRGKPVVIDTAAIKLDEDAMAEMQKSIMEGVANRQAEARREAEKMAAAAGNGRNGGS